MKIAWFTPLSRRSAIARFSVAVTASLSKLADVELCCFDADDVRETGVATRRFRSAAAVTQETLGRHDIVVYNLGNYLPFHRDIYLASKTVPGICILHDFVMHHFFAGYYFDYLQDPNGYKLLIERTCGESGAIGERIWETDDVVRFPLFEEAIRGAVGVVTHSEFFRRHVEVCFPGPVTRIPLAYDGGAKAVAMSRAELGVRSDQILIVSVGHVNPNRKIESVIRAFAELGLRSKSLVYAIVGSASPDYERKLKSAARDGKVADAVRFLGHVSDEVLAGYLSAADLCINLRFPATEGASASVIEEMLFGKPVVVTDTGFFSELPDECVVKVRPGDGADLAAALRRLVNDASARKLIGARAKAFAEREFSADRYAKELTEFVWEVQSARPILNLADRVGSELSRMGARGDMTVVDVFAREIEAAFVEKRPRGPLRNP